MDYYFFFSYAHADDDAYLREFYKHLHKEVRGLAGAAPEEVSFLDREAIAHGATWDAALEKGLQSCKVFIPVYSASYFRALYCGKEFAVFRQRLHQHLQQLGKPVDDSLVLPVLWMPEQNVLKDLPVVINKIQFKHGAYPNEYTSEGVQQLFRLGATSTSRYYNEYWQFVRTFAQTILNTANSLQLPQQTGSLTPLDQVSSLFSTSAPPPTTATAGPRYIQFIFVAGRQSDFQKLRMNSNLKYYGPNGGSDWFPYVDNYKGTARTLAIEAVEAFSKECTYEEVQITSGIDQQAKLAASQDKIVVVVVDTWTLRLANYSQLIAPLDQYSSFNCITLIVWNEADNETPLFKGVLETAVKGIFQTKSAYKPPNFLPNSVKSYETFKSELVKALVHAQTQIVETADIKRQMPAVFFQNGSDEFANKPSL